MQRPSYLKVAIRATRSRLPAPIAKTSVTPTKPRRRPAACLRILVAPAPGQPPPAHPHLCLPHRIRSRLRRPRNHRLHRKLLHNRHRHHWRHPLQPTPTLQNICPMQLGFCPSGNTCVAQAAGKCTVGITKTWTDPNTGLTCQGVTDINTSTIGATMTIPGASGTATSTTVPAAGTEEFTCAASGWTADAPTRSCTCPTNYVASGNQCALPLCQQIPSTSAAAHRPYRPSPLPNPNLLRTRIHRERHHCRHSHLHLHRLL